MQEKDGQEYDSDYDEIDTYGEDKLEDKVYYGSDTTTEMGSSDDEIQELPDGSKRKTVKLYKITNPYLSSEDEDGELQYQDDSEEGEEELEEEDDGNEMEFEEIKVSENLKKKTKKVQEAEDFEQIQPKQKLQRKFVPYESESTDNTPKSNSLNSSATSSQIDESDAASEQSIEMVDLKKPSTISSEMREFKPSGLVNHSKKKREKRKAKKEADKKLAQLAE